MDNPGGNKTIAKNTVFLYLRMLIIMVVSLYTSRVILQVLGVDDFGLYQTVGGIVGFLVFVNHALSTGTSRFITIALGEGDEDRLNITFSLTFWAHLALALIVALAAETIGLWYFNHKMVIPEARFSAARIVYHISIASAFLGILRVPFSAAVIAHEKMSLFAFIGITEAISKLGIVYLLTVGGMDKLVLYAILQFALQIALFAFYFFYCFFHFHESRIRICYDGALFKNIVSFSGWSLFSNGAIALSNQGIILLLNLFFAPAIVSARTISLQVNNVVSQFVNNFRTAATPQIVKRYAAGDFSGSKTLLLESTKFSYYLMLILVLPLCLLANPILNIWLVEVPPLTTEFLQIVLVQSLFQVFDTSFYSALYAKGQIRENAILSPLVGYIVFPIVYFMFKAGMHPLALSWAILAQYVIIGVIIKPILLHKIAGYPWKDILNVFRACTLVTLTAVPIPLVLFLFMGTDALYKSIILLLVSVLFVIISVWFVGLSESMKKQVIQAISRRK